MQFSVYIFSLVAIIGLALIFLFAPWLKKLRASWRLPMLLSILLLSFSGIWYGYTGSGQHIFYDEENTALQQIALLLEDNLPLGSELQKRIATELESQQYRATAQPTVFVLQAQLAMQQRDYKKAMSAYKKAYQLLPDDEDIAISYAQTWYMVEQQNASPALATFLQELETRYPNQTGLKNLLAVMAYNKGDYAKAIQLWQQILPEFSENSTEAQAIRSGIEKAKQNGE